jgi:toxin-antitoxin system PIN domain toxin
MKLIDLNVLMYAVNSAAPLHKKVLTWWEEALSGDEPVALCWAVLIGFVRIATRPGIFPRPLTVDDACARVDRWLAWPVVQVIGETETHWSLLKRLLAEVGSAGNLTTDAHLAALALSHGATLVSCDRDFARFSGLRCENPAEG